MSVHATEQLESGRANDTAKIWYEELCADDSDWESKVLQFFQYIQTQVGDIAEYMQKKPNYKELYGSYKVLSEALSILIEREITDFSFYEEMLDTVGLMPGDFWGDYAEEAKVEYTENMLERLWDECLIDEETYKWLSYEEKDAEEQGLI